MYIVYYETENHYNSKVHAIVRMANFKVSRNLVSESLYEEIRFYSFFGTQILTCLGDIRKITYYLVINKSGIFD